MRGKAPALPLTVNARLRKLIEKEGSRTSISVRLKIRLKIILDGINGKSISQTERELDSNWQTISKWRKRWEESVAMLIEASESVKPSKAIKDHELLDMIKKVLSDKPRSGTPKRITLEQEAQIRALACTKPTEHGIEMNNWTHEMLTQVVKMKGIVDKISVRNVGKILKKTK
jgi:transposase